MKYLSTLALTLFIYSCSSTTNKLEDKEQTLELHYISWACECANWATPADIEKFQDTGKLSDYCVFVESNNPDLILSDAIGYPADAIQFTGRFYVDKGYQNDYVKTYQKVDKPIVFRYTKFKILKSNYREFISDTSKNH